MISKNAVSALELAFSQHNHEPSSILQFWQINICMHSISIARRSVLRAKQLHTMAHLCTRTIDGQWLRRPTRTGKQLSMGGCWWCRCTYTPLMLIVNPSTPSSGPLGRPRLCRPLLLSPTIMHTHICMPSGMDGFSARKVAPDARCPLSDATNVWSTVGGLTKRPSAVHQ